MNFATILSTIETHIKEYETAITNSLANHNSLLGGLAALQRTLGILTPIVEELDPAATPVINVVDGVIEDVESLATPAKVVPIAG